MAPCAVAQSALGRALRPLLPLPALAMMLVAGARIGLWRAAWACPQLNPPYIRRNGQNVNDKTFYIGWDPTSTTLGQYRNALHIEETGALDVDFRFSWNGSEFVKDGEYADTTGATWKGDGGGVGGWCQMDDICKWDDLATIPPGEGGRRDDPLERAKVTIFVFKYDITEPKEDEVYLAGQSLTFESLVQPSDIPAQHYLWSVLEGDCEPSSGSGTEFETVLESPGTVKVRFEVGFDDGCGGTDSYRRERRITVVTPEITQVNFQGTVCTLKSHVDESIVSSDSIPEWTSPFAQDNVTTNNDAAYKRNTSPEGTDAATCNIKCQATNPLTHSTSVQVKADGDPENLYPVSAYFNNWSAELNLDQGSPYRQSIYQYVNNFDYTWYYRVEKPTGAWGNWVQMKRNPTHHNISIVHNSISGPQYQWLIMNSRKLASGVLSTATDKQIVDQIYEHLPDSRSSDDCVITNDDWADANKLKYGIPGWSTVAILNNRGGMCGGWSKFFCDLAAAQGIVLQKRAYLLKATASPDPEVKWYSLLIENPGLNQSQVTNLPMDFKDVNAAKYPFPLYPGDITYSANLRRYKFNSPSDGHAVDFIESGGNNYLYDPCFGPYSDDGIIQDAYSSIPSGNRNGAENNAFRTEYFNSLVPRLYGRIWYRYAANTQLDSDIGTTDTTIAVASTASADSSGAICIEGEIVAYTGKTSNTFTGCSRGQYGTTAAGHVQNAIVQLIKTESGETPPSNFCVCSPEVEESGLNLEWISSW